MSAKTTVTLEEYLRTSHPKPNPEYRDGEIVERSMPTYLHGKTQGIIGALFWPLRSRFPVFPCVGVRLIMGPTKVLIPDVSVFSPTEPAELHPTQPPLVAIEILSPDDRMSAVRAKLDEYRAWGVHYVWLVDPESRRFYTCGERRLAEVPTLELPEFDFRISPSDLFQ